jgi:hypothetical protein
MGASDTLAPVLLAMLLLCSCEHTSARRLALDTRSSITRDEALSLVEHEVSRRALPLPSKWKAQVQNSFVDYEFRPSRAIYAVTIYVIANGKRKNLYEVNVDKLSGKIEDFADTRKAVPIDAR